MKYDQCRVWLKRSLKLVGSVIATRAWNCILTIHTLCQQVKFTVRGVKTRLLTRMSLFVQVAKAAITSCVQ